jgi:hypothetical protein
MIVRLKMMTMTFEDHLWREVSNVHMSEQMLGATITFVTVRGEKLEIDSRRAAYMFMRKRSKSVCTTSDEIATWKRNEPLRAAYSFNRLRPPLRRHKPKIRFKF